MEPLKRLSRRVLWCDLFLGRSLAEMCMIDLMGEKTRNGETGCQRKNLLEFLILLHFVGVNSQRIKT